MSLRPYLTISPRFDLRGLSGTTLWSRDTDDIAFPTFDTATDEGVFEDIYDLAHSRGSDAKAADPTKRHDLSSGLDDDWDSTAYLTIGETDRFEFRGPEPFALGASADNAIFGFDVAGQSSADESGVHVIRAPDAWIRGVVEGAQLQITPDGEAAFNVPSTTAYRAQSPVVMARRRNRLLESAGGTVGAFDADDMARTTCLEELDNDAADATERRIRHYLGDDGHYVMAWPTAASLDPPVWASTADARALRDRLGYAGTETVTTSGGVSIFRAAKPAAVVTTARPWRRKPQPIGGESTSAERLALGGAAVAHVATWTDWIFDFWLDGPDSPNTADDLVQHFQDVVRQHMPQGWPITVTVGRDTRRRIGPHEINAETPAFSLLYSSARCSGSWRVIRSPDDPAAMRIEYADDQGGDFWAQALLIVAARRAE